MYDILDPGFNLTLRPMRYPQFFRMYQDAIKNTWTVSEVNFSTDIIDLREHLTKSERHLINRIVAFFATGDAIVANNVVLNLYQHLNSPEARMYLGRQLFEECLHSEFYLTLLDNYIPDLDERHEAFDAIENIPSIKRKAEFCFKWMNIPKDPLVNDELKRRFILNLITFACAVEGLFFFAAFAYVFFLRDKGLLNGLADGTNWVMRDESGGHMVFAFEVINVIRAESPHLFDAELEASVVEMMRDAVECEAQFAADVLSEGVTGLPYGQMVQYLEFTADQRMKDIGFPEVYGGRRNPFGFIELQNVQMLSNFFERTVDQYQIGVVGVVDLDSDF